MKNLFRYLQARQNNIATLFAFIFSVLFVVYLSPREAKFKYEFQKGKPWLYENLVAPFDFSIIKTEEALEQEKKEIQQNKTLFLVKDSEVQVQAEADFEKEFGKKWKDFKESEEFKEARGFSLFKNQERELALKTKLLQRGKDALDLVYKQGILRPIGSDLANDYGEILLRTDVDRAVFEEDFLTIKEASLKAQAQIIKTDSLGFSFLLGIINNNLNYNIEFDQERTESILQAQIDEILPTQGMVQSEELVIFKGNLVDDEKYAKLLSLKTAYEGSFTTKSRAYLISTGQFFLIGILFLVLYLFMYQMRRKVVEDFSKVAFILLNVLLTVAMGKIAVDFGVEYIYLAPFPILPIIIRSFFDTRFALFVHMVAILMVGFLVPNSFEFVFLQFVAGVFAVILVNNLYKRSQLFLTAAKIIGVYSLAHFSLSIIQEGSLNLEEGEWLIFAFFIGNGLLTLMSFPFIYLQEKIFGFVSDVSLLELSDTNSPLLRELAQKAPGTFQHSLQVANLAEAAVLNIGGNALLVRTGAMYHDIGKMASPMYFIENQNTGLNPHDELSFEESAEIIIGHVKEGIKIAKKNNLPDVLVDFIRTHHGTTTVMYFYKQYIKNFPENEADISRFSYPGPKPFSKETAALMMADSVEAAARSIQNPDHEKIDKLVEGIVNHQMGSGQFENAEITLKEIKDIKKIFKKMLMNIYHVRIQYPE